MEVLLILNKDTTSVRLVKLCLHNNTAVSLGSPAQRSRFAERCSEDRNKNNQQVNIMLSF